MSAKRIGVIAASTVLGVFAPLFLFAPVAFAQVTGLEVQPAIIEANVNPGQQYSFAITVKNISSTQQTFTIGAQDISGLTEGGQPIFAQPGQETSYSLSAWIPTPQAPLTLQPGQSQTIPFTANVPANASPGAHFGSVFFESGTTKTAGNGSGIGFDVGSVISLQIAGNIVENSRILEFSTDQLTYNSPTVNFTTKVENMGNVLDRPHGVIQITDMWGNQVGNVTVNDNAAPVFPGSTRAYVVNWQGSGFAIGRYQAVLSLSYGENTKQTITAATSFWIIPLKLVGSIIGAILVLILVIYFGVRSYLRKQLRAMGVSSGGNEMSYYANRYNKSGSRLVFTVLGILLLCILLLVIIFVMFS